MQDARTPFLTKREVAVAKVKDAILAGRYRPGQALRQVQLMADLDLGATPAREAVLELVAKGLLVHESHRGMRVAGLDAERVRHVYSVRALLESEAARLSAAVASDAAIERARARAAGDEKRARRQRPEKTERRGRTLSPGAVRGRGESGPPSPD
jgi:DNA-binding GntR family transcriptional regulator